MADEQEKVVEKNPDAPLAWWAKILLDAAGIYLISTKTPILEILNLFFYIVMVPIGLLMSIGLISSGSVQAFSRGWGNMLTDVKNKIEDKVSEKVQDHEESKRTKAA